MVKWYVIYRAQVYSIENSATVDRLASGPRWGSVRVRSTG